MKKVSHIPLSRLDEADDFNEHNVHWELMCENETEVVDFL